VPRGGVAFCVSRIPEAITERIRQANDIVDVVSTYVALRPSGRSYKGLCPFHQEKTPSFHVVPEKQIFKCFGCQAGGDVFTFVQLKEGVDFREALAILARRAGITLEERPAAGPDAGPTRDDIDRVNRWAARWFARQLASDAGAAARQYVRDRGIVDAAAERFGLGFAPPGWEKLPDVARRQGISAALLEAAGLLRRRDDGSHYDAFRNRLMFSIVDVMGRVIGFGGRALDDDPAKYLNTPQTALFDKRRSLYGIRTAREAMTRHRCAVVVEGYTDCLLAQQAGVEHTVATLGTALTPEHVQLLRRYVDEVILVFDSDEAGRRAADQSLALFLTAGLDIRVTHVPEGKDPADLLVSAGKSAFEAVLTAATPALEFKWNQVLRQYNAGASGPERRRATEEFIQLLAGQTDLGDIGPIQRGLILNQVGKLLGLPSEDVYRQLRSLARRNRVARHAGEAPTEGARIRDARAAATRELLEVLLNEPTYYASIAGEFHPAYLRDPTLVHIGRALVELLGDTPTDTSTEGTSAEGTSTEGTSAEGTSTEGTSTEGTSAEGAAPGERFSLAAFISRFESPEIGRCITALQSAGERRGNYAATVEGAVSRLQQLRDVSRVDDLADQWRTEGRRQDHSVAGAVEGEEAEATSDRPPVEPTAVGDAPASETALKLRAMSDVARRANRFAARRHERAMPTPPPG